MSLHPDDLYASAVELEPTWERSGYADQDIESALLTIAGHGVHDGEAGDVDTIGFHCAQVGQYVLTTDDHGNRTWSEYMTPATASAHLRRVDDRMAQVQGEL